jgi:hypothetical protein
MHFAELRPGSMRRAPLYAGVWALTKAARRARAEKDWKDRMVGRDERIINECRWKGV